MCDLLQRITSPLSLIPFFQLQCKYHVLYLGQTTLKMEKLDITHAID